jgi:ergothioneine biosynthesis protein EgtB
MARRTLAPIADCGRRYDVRLASGNLLMNASSAPQPAPLPPPPPIAKPAADDLAARFRAVRAATEALAAPLTPEDCALQSMASCSPVKWHLAHTSWFFETFILGDCRGGVLRDCRGGVLRDRRGGVLSDGLRGYAPLRAEYRTLFNSYYQQVGERWPRSERGLLSRPSLEEVRGYRRHVDRAMAELLASPSAAEPRLRERVELGLQHEEQHQELLLTDVKHLFSRNPLRPAYRAESAETTPAPRGPAAAAPALRWHRFDGGVREVGHRGGGFAFDNESPRHSVFVAPFELASRLVTNRDFLAFLEDGGYRRPELWLAEGFDAVQAKRWSAPLYWEARDGGWRQFTLAGLRPLDLDEPLCHVSLFEADAFARWSGLRLPTEAEWEVAAAALPVAGNFVESGALHPRALARDDDRSLQQMFGDVWEWTQSAYSPYPGYRAPEGAIGEYNGKFMVNQHVLRGGSCVSPQGHLRATYRNFFHADERWQFMGLRLARDAS